MSTVVMSRFMCPAEHWTIFYCFLYVGSICSCSMYVLCASNPAVAAKSNKPLLLLLFIPTSSLANKYVSVEALMNCINFQSVC